MLLRFISVGVFLRARTFRARVKVKNVGRFFGGGFAPILILSTHTIYSICVVLPQRFGFSCREEQRSYTVSFCFPDPLSQTMKDFSIQFGGLEGHPCHRAKTGSLSDFPFPVQLRRVLTLKDVPSTLRSLVEVIAQHANQKA